MLDRTALRDTWQVAVASRALIWVVAIVAVLRFGVEPKITPPHEVVLGSWTPQLLVAPAVPWDAGHYVAIAQHGYDTPMRAAFFPLYPLLVRGVGAVIGSEVWAGVVLALGALFAALYLLHRLVALELGPRYPRAALLVTALFPTAFFFSAIYTESLFLALTVGAFYFARRERWALAALCGALAAATRNTGVLLLVPLALMPRARRRDAAWLAAIPAGLVAVLAYWAHRGNWKAPFDAQRFWDRSFSPLGGLLHGSWDAVVSFGQLVAGPAHHVLTTPTPAQNGILSVPTTLATVNLTDFAFVAFAVVGCVGAARRLPLAYPAYGAVGIAAAVSAPTKFEPLMSMPRYAAVLFPAQMWLAAWAVDRGRLNQTLTVCAAALALLTAEFAGWRWVA
jgi:Mannosyltransferase (PIG-V)